MEIIGMNATEKCILEHPNTVELVRELYANNMRFIFDSHPIGGEYFVFENDNRRQQAATIAKRIIANSSSAMNDYIMRKAPCGQVLPTNIVYKKVALRVKDSRIISLDPKYVTEAGISARLDKALHLWIPSNSEVLAEYNITAYLVKQRILQRHKGLINANMVKLHKMSVRKLDE